MMPNGTNGGGNGRRAQGAVAVGRGASPAAREAVARLLRALGEDPEREGLRDTPERVVASLLELTSGYAEDPAAVLGRVFAEAHEEMVLVRGIPFTSLCEHHLLPVVGEATVAYLPAGRVVGLSKLSRIVQTFARRLQLQERMTDEIAKAIDTHLAPRGVAVLVTARHACMALRGVRTDAPMITSAYVREMREAERRSEFLRLAT
jgi:GTP cyclohydrolase IA